LFYKATRGELGALLFLDLDVDVVDREIDRMKATRHSGPSAENVLRDLGEPRVGNLS
jgi:pyruvate ferredoxin oxidoreductase alpha subunit